jgi:uncharacterized integral membrane protein
MRRAIRMSLKQWSKALVYTIMLCLLLGLSLVLVFVLVNVVQRTGFEVSAKEGFLVGLGASILLTAISGAVVMVFPAMIYMEARCRMEAFHLDTLRQ